MSPGKFLACLLPLLAGAVHAQDELRVPSPDGQLEFRLFTFVPGGNGLNTLAYQVRWRGQLVVDTSALGMNIHFQEPMLGENVGLSSSKTLHEGGYNGLVADYLQNSSTGRRIGLEVRVWNDSVAFRYLIPKQWPILDLLIEDDGTEFHFAGAAEVPEKATLPYCTQSPGGWAGIFESRAPGFPAMSLVKNDARTFLAHLPDKPHDPAVAYVGVTPWTGPWRIVAVGTEREKLAQSSAVQALAQ
jgi:hypothetical protein